MCDVTCELLDLITHFGLLVMKKLNYIKGGAMHPYFEDMFFNDIGGALHTGCALHPAFLCSFNRVCVTPPV